VCVLLHAGSAKSLRLKHRRLHCTVTAFPAEDASRVFKIGEFGRKAGEQFPSCH